MTFCIEDVPSPPSPLPPPPQIEVTCTTFCVEDVPHCPHCPQIQVVGATFWIENTIGACVCYIPWHSVRVGVIQVAGFVLMIGQETRSEVVSQGKRVVDRKEEDVAGPYNEQKGGVGEIPRCPCQAGT